MTFELLCATMIALLFGTIVCFGGYRLFLALLPIWGFFFGFGLGAQTIQALIGDALLSTVTSWVVGFIVAILFAVLSYMFYTLAVAILAGSLGYAAGVALMGLFSADLTLITWIVGILLGIIFIGITFYFNLAKYMIIVATTVVGAGITIGTLALGVGNVQLMQLLNTPLRTMLDDSPLWTILFLILAVLGIVTQLRVNRAVKIEAYNRWATS